MGDSNGSVGNSSKSGSWQETAILIGIGLFAGLSSGMFGVGGGTIIVPTLITFAHFSPRISSGTSLAVIIPLASVGVISYALAGSVSWLAALLIAAGAMAGTRVGTWLLTKVAQKPLQIMFSFAMVLAIVSMFLVIPSREAVLEIGWISGLSLVGLGVITGVLAGLLGVGGGLIVVPSLMFFFGASDLVAKGTSLLMMIPSAILGTFSNYKRGNVNLRAAAIIGVSASLTTFVGARFAMLVSPRIANLLFAAFLSVMAFRLFTLALSSKER